MYLSGYGVELAIKSTEYKAVDDSQAKGTPPPPFPVCGVIGDIIITKYSTVSRILKAVIFCMATLKLMENGLLGQ